MVSCTIITIGDELLIGQTIDTNSAFIAQRLEEIGISVRRRIAIGDQKSEIIESIEHGLSLSEVLIFTGGLGPTKDDITKKTFADFFQVKMSRDQETFEFVRNFFESRNLPFLEVNHAQADVPENAIVLHNKRGTAPGMWFEYDNKIIVSLPGVPFEMEYLLVNEVIPKLQSQYTQDPIYHYHIQTSGIGESMIANRIEHIEKNLLWNIRLAYLPSVGHVHLRLSGYQKDIEKITNIGQEIIAELSEYVYHHDTCINIFELVYDLLASHNENFGTIESASGGHLADTITNIKGASSVYFGGYVTYMDEAKMALLDVSKEEIADNLSTSRSMVEILFDKGLEKLKTDYLIAVVGHLEKNIDQLPYTWYAIGNQNHKIIGKINLIYPRIKSKQALTHKVFVEFYKFIKKEKNKII